MNRARKSKVKPPNVGSVYRHVRIPPAAPSDPNHHPYHVFSAIRSRRAPSGDPLVDFIDHMESIARIATGISLELALIDGSLNIEDVVPELLHMGNFTIADINSIDDAKVTSAMDGIRDLPGKLTSSAGITKVEKRIRELDDLRKASQKWGDLMSLAGKDDYKTKIEALGNPHFDDAELSKLTAGVVNALDLLKQIEGSMPKDSTNTELLVTAKGTLKTFTDNVRSLEPSFKALADIKRVAGAFEKPLLDEFEVRQHFTAKTSTQADEDGARNNLAALVGASGVFQSANPFLKTIRDLIRTRQTSKLWKFVHTPGFPKGLVDFEDLKRSADNEWVKKKMGSAAGRTVDGLKKAFELMDGTKQSVRNIEDVLMPINRNTLASILKTIDAQLAISAMSQAEVDVINGIVKCETDHPPNGPPNPSEMSTVLNAMDDLHKKIRDVSYIEKFGELKDFDTLGLIITNGLNDAVANEKFRELQNEKKDTVTKLIKLLESVINERSRMDALNTALANQPQIIKDNFQLVQTYQDNLRSSKMLDFYGCLKTKGGTGDVVDSVMQPMDNIRALGASSGISDATAGVTAVLKTKNHFSDVSKKASSLVQKKTTETKALKKTVPDANVISQRLGMAVQGLQKIREVEEAKIELGVLLGDLAFIQTAVDNNRSSLTAEEQQVLLSIQSLGANLNTMYQQIAAFRGSLSGVADGKLADYSSIFESAADKVKTVSVDTKALLAAVQKLTEIDPSFSNASALKASLERLDTLDLDFASYKMSEVKEALQKMDQLFFNFASNIPISASHPGRGGSRNGLDPASGAHQVTTTDSSDEWKVALGIGGVVAFLACIAVVVFVVKCCLRKKEKSEELHDAPSPDAAASQNGKQPKERVFDLDVTQEYLVSNDDLFEMFSRYLNVILNEFFSPTVRGTLVKPLAVEMTQLIILYPERFTSTTAYGVDNEMRNPDSIFCRRSTAVTVEGFKNSFIHANKMQIEGETWIMCQAPSDYINFERISTLEKHWAMICQQNVKIMVQLCNFVEKGIEKCARYYTDDVGKTKQFGKYTVTTKKSIDVSHRFTYSKDYKCFELQCLDTKTNVSHTVVLLRFVGWPDNEGVEEPEHGYEIVEFLDSYKGTKIVHCSAGVGRTGTVVAIKKGIEISLNGSGNSVFKFIEPVRGCRLHAVKTPCQAFYVLMSVGKALMKHRNIAELEDYDKLMAIYLLVAKKQVKGGGEFDGPTYIRPDKNDKGGVSKDDKGGITKNDKGGVTKNDNGGATKDGANNIDDNQKRKEDTEKAREALDKVEKIWVEKKKKKAEEEAEVLRVAEEERKERKAALMKKLDADMKTAEEMEKVDKPKEEKVGEKEQSKTPEKEEKKADGNGELGKEPKKVSLEKDVKPDEKKADEKKPDEKKPGEKKADEKKPGEKKADEKKAEVNKDGKAGEQQKKTTSKKDEKKVEQKPAGEGQKADV